MDLLLYKVGKVHDLNWSPKFRRQNDLFGFTEKNVSENNFIVRPEITCADIGLSLHNNDLL